MVTVTDHVAKPVSDVNRKLKITAADPANPGGGYTVYFIEHQDRLWSIEIVFQTPGTPGLTNEALLAIVGHRLRGFQEGDTKCEENASALYGIDAALAALKRRTERRAAHGLEGTRVEDPSTYGKPFPKEAIVSTEKPPETGNPARVRFEGDVLYIGALGFLPAAAAQWKTWNTIESACKALKPALTTAEMDIISSAAAKLGGAARNGFTEFKQAMAQVSKA
jgi:hypothetical protein